MSSRGTPESNSPQKRTARLSYVSRHLEPYEWGRAFAMLLEERGIQRGKGGDRRSTSKVAVDTIAKVAGELGVAHATAEKRLKAADDYGSLNREEQEQEQVRAKEKSLAQASIHVVGRSGSLELALALSPLPRGSLNASKMA